MTRSASNIILVGIIVAVGLALLSVKIWGAEMAGVKWLGDFFLLALRMIVVPLVLASVIVGITGLGDIRKLGRIGFRTLGYYALTTSLAVALGIVLVLIIRPGEGARLTEATAEATAAAEAGESGEARAAAEAGGAGEATRPGTAKVRELTAKERAKVEELRARGEKEGWQDIVLSFLSPNIFAALVKPDMLPIIVFALLFGGILTTLGSRGKPVIAFFDGFNEAIMKMVHLIMWIAPIGIFGLIASRFGAAEDLGALLESLADYILTVLLGLGIHFLVILPLLCVLLGRRNPFRHLQAMFPAILTAWSTASSSATLPLTIECAEERAKVDDKATGFVLPLGATINMDGTALYESVAAIFIAQAYGVPLGIGAIVLIFLTATLASIGAAGIPEAGLFTMVIVLTAVGLPLDGIGLILAIDWFLDRFRTATNVWGDAVGAGYIHRFTAPDPGTER